MLPPKSMSHVNSVSTMCETPGSWLQDEVAALSTLSDDLAYQTPTIGSPCARAFSYTHALVWSPRKGTFS